ncbi:MAG: hypothetical protein IJ397_07140 [Lachnospiraceae bacterium]|nr:hypothetical protein [Lachnospiraceae bacterium]
MKIDKQIIITFMTVYFINRFTKQYNNIPVIGYLCKCHVNDFIGGVVFCAYTNCILHWAKAKRITKIFHILFYIFACGMLWEFFFPIVLSYSVSDWLDVLSYLLGGLTYYLIIRKMRGKEIKNEGQEK